MGWNITTGLDADQLDELVARVHQELVEDPDPPVVPGRMWSLGLYRSVVLVLFLLRQHPVQVLQPWVSVEWVTRCSVHGGGACGAGVVGLVR
ncbi:hypothetical protein, partial [Streptomyces cinereoruber]|uniref:hypothetical protein n=1 Tax=Streptomyces cinereoruber TaxID=67260 RepID=UPI0036675EFE